MTLLKQEWKMNIKSLLIWTLCVGLCCSGCILLFDSVAESMDTQITHLINEPSFSINPSFFYCTLSKIC